MTEKQYLEAVQRAFVAADEDGYVSINGISPGILMMETERRLTALKAQEDNIKSDHWEEKK